MIFVDTGPWFASTFPRDLRYQFTREWLLKNQDRLVTTDWIVDETLTLLRARGAGKAAVEVGIDFFESRLYWVETVRGADILDAWSVFKTFDDKGWSFTDCVSKVVMERLGVTKAFTFDEHFRQFGTIEVIT